MNPKKSIQNLTKFEWALWAGGMLLVIGSYLFSREGVLSLIASLIGVTALIFVAKGDALGQLLTVVFSLFYAAVSYKFKYYGEMITYLGMSAPMAMFSVISWLKHPYAECEVKIKKLTKANIIILIFLSVAVSFLFYFILKALGTNTLLVSTFSVTTSFFAASFLFLRSPYYAAAYALNDIVLIVLWVVASIRDISFVPMVICFAVFFANDLYGFINWKKLQKKQSE